MNPKDEEGKIWMNGSFVDWKNAKIHVMSHVIHYGTSVFEGIRCYKTPKGPAVFRLNDHIRRLFDSAKIYRIDIPYSQEDIVNVCKSVVRENNLESAYIRPIAYRGYHSLGVDPSACPVDMVVAVMRWGRYLGEQAITQGVDVRISSWNRLAPNTMPTLAKAGANYMNSQLIKLEALQDGYTEGIGLDIHGHVSEGSGENIFVIRDGIIYTTPVDASILPGITRASVIKIAEEFGIKVVEAHISREFLYIADEIFFTGTAAEVTPVRSIDHIPIGQGKRGQITEKIQTRYFEYVNGERQDIHGWHNYV